MSRPLVLLDVDGVLNAIPRFGDLGAWESARTGEADAAGSRFRITWSPAVVEAVRSWREVADVQWLTTWGHDANLSLRHLVGLPELAVAGTYDDQAGSAGLEGIPDSDARPGAHADVAPAARDPLTGRWWKFDVVRLLVRAEPRRRIAWLDDDLAGQDDIRGWMRREVPCLLVAPEPAYGLTAAHLDSVDTFLRG